MKKKTKLTEKPPDFQACIALNFLIDHIALMDIKLGHG